MQRARVGRFELTRRLGAGAAGEVWEARDPELDRAVAVKLLRPGTAQGLIAEARAMAKLAHPNVVTVFDAGDDDGQVWIAMELVAGGTLRAWMEGRPGWRAVVEAFAAAGRGLAAAHRAGIVHRDFKPDNVLVRDDGRVLVGDFGVARAAGAAGAGVDGANAETAPGAGAEATGGLVGTPAYMAPEQHLGRAVDARADQFAFCVSLWEALYGERPFAPTAADSRTTGVGVGTAIVTGRRRPPPDRARAPRWLRRVLDRGLAVERDDRFASMDAVVAALERGLGRRRRIALGAAGGVAAAALAAAVLWPRAAAGPRCDGAPRAWGAAWDDARRDAVTRAFEASGAAPTTIARVTAALDARRDGWIAKHLEVCRATHVDGAQSPEILDRRMACLDDRRRRVELLVTALGTADRAIASRAEDALDAMPGVADCTAEAPADDPLPDDPAQRDRALALREELRAIEIRGGLGELAQARDIEARIADDAAALGLARLAALARFGEGYFASQLQDHARARRALDAATGLAADARDDRVAAMAWSELVLTLVDDRALAEARTLLRPADAAVRRAGEPAIERHRLNQAEGMLTFLEGEPAKALPLLTRALAFTDAHLGEDSNFATEALANLATVESQLGEHAAALAHRRREVAIEEARLGEDSGAYATALGELGIALRQAGDPEALATLRDAVARSEAAGVTGPPLAILLQSLGNAEEDPALAVAASRRAVELFRAAGSSQLGTALAGLGAILEYAGDRAGAIAATQEALPLIEATIGREQFQYAISEGNLGAFLPCDARALTLLAHASAVLGDQIGAEHPVTLNVRLALGTCQLVLAPDDGVATVAAALDACAQVECDPAAVTQARDELAKHRRR